MSRRMVIVALLAAPFAASAQSRAVTDLGNVSPGYSDFSDAVNQSGGIAGTASEASSLNHEIAEVTGWNRGPEFQLNSLPGTKGNWGYGVNSAGVVVGYVPEVGPSVAGNVRHNVVGSATAGGASADSRSSSGSAAALVVAPGQTLTIDGNGKIVAPASASLNPAAGEYPTLWYSKLWNDKSLTVSAAHAGTIFNAATVHGEVSHYVGHSTLMADTQALAIEAQQSKVDTKGILDLSFLNAAAIANAGVATGNSGDGSTDENTGMPRYGLGAAALVSGRMSGGESAGAGSVGAEPRVAAALLGQVASLNPSPALAVAALPSLASSATSSSAASLGADTTREISKTGRFGGDNYEIASDNAGSERLGFYINHAAVAPEFDIESAASGLMLLLGCLLLLRSRMRRQPD